METALAPAQTTKAQTASLFPTKQPAKPGPTELQIKVAAVQRASGNQAVQRAVESEVSEAGETVEKAPETPKEDKKHQAVAKEMTAKAKVERTPISTPEEKQKDTVLAANAESKEVIETTNARLDHIDKLGEVRPKDLTAKEFMEEFDAAITKLEQTVPTKKSVAQTAKFVTGQRQAKQDFAAEDKKNSEPLRQELNREPTCPEDKKVVPATYELTQDPAGATPSVKQAKAAAPKPSADATVSLDEQSRELDDALVNHDVHGQRIDIKEESLAFPVSGEKSFDEAAEAKREAQAEIAKAKPQYRQEEKGVINRAQNDFQSLVNIRGLMGHHKLRSIRFKEVLAHQTDHKAGIKTVKQQFFEKVEGIYGDTKSEVDAELNSLQEIESIEETFEDILKEANDWFTGHTKTNLEYINPDILALEYSDFVEDHSQKILDEYNRLAGEKYRHLDELIERLSEKSETLGEMAKGVKRFAGVDINLYFQALSNVKEQAAQELFDFAKGHFIFLVKSNVELKIAKRVAIAINRARRAIDKGKDRVKRAYDRLSPTEKFEVEEVYNAVNDRFADLHKSVDERQHEIINEMARTYTKSVGKLKSTFDEIKKNVEAGILGRAWNKIKAVVNAIIDFATKIAELLGRMLHLLPDIISGPGEFFSNLGSGIKQGIDTFIAGLPEYLATAFFDWIRGSSGVQVQLPKEFDPPGIFSLFTQLLNVTTETVWLRMEVVYDKSIADAFRKGEFALEKALEIFDIIKREGLGGLWDHIVESLGTLLSDTLDTLKEQVLKAAITKVLLEIGKLLVPGGGFIAIAEKIIRLLVFIFEARDKIVELIGAFVSSMENAVRGDIGGIVNLVTTALKSFITFALDFLVAFFGLSSLKEKVERMIERMRSPIIRGIDFVLKKFKPLVMKGAELVAKGKEKVVETGKKVAAKVINWLGIRKRFTSEGETHTLFFRGTETSAQLWVATEEMPFTTLLKNKKGEIDAISDKQTKSRKLIALTNATTIYNNDIVRIKDALARATDEPTKIQLQSDLNDKFNEIVPHLVIIGVGSGGRRPKTLVKIGSPGARATWVEANPVTEIDSIKSKRVEAEPLGWASHIKTIANYDDIYVRLHLLHFNLGGPGNDTGNVTPGRKTENTNMSNQAEEKAIDLVHNKGKVLWYKSEITGYRSEAGYTDFAEGIRIRYGFKDKNDAGEFTKVGDVIYEKVFPVSKPDPKGTNDPVPTINTLTFDYWDDVLTNIPNRPTQRVYRKLIAERNKREKPYGGLPEFFSSKEFKDAEADYEGDLEDWFKNAIAQGKIRAI